MTKEIYSYQTEDKASLMYVKNIKNNQFDGFSIDPFEWTVATNNPIKFYFDELYYSDLDLNRSIVDIAKKSRRGMGNNCYINPLTEKSKIKTNFSTIQFIEYSDCPINQLWLFYAGSDLFDKAIAWNGSKVAVNPNYKSYGAKIKL
jgi:hypothetical protein